MRHPLSQGATEVTEGEGRCWKRCNVNFFAELLECFYSSSVSVAGGWSYSKLLVVMEESFKKWAGHAGMLSGCDAACGPCCRNWDTWKQDNASARELFTPAIWVTITCMLCRAAQKYSNLMRAMMSVALVEPFFHMSTTARLSQWKRTFWRDQRQPQECTAQTIA